MVREARSDLWQLMEFSKRFTTDEVWPEDLLAKAPEYRGKTLFDVLFANGEANKFPLSEIDPGYENQGVEALRLLRTEGIVRGDAGSAAATGTIRALRRV